MIESFHRSKMLETRYKFSLPNPAEEEVRRQRKLNGLSTSFHYSMHELEKTPHVPMDETGLGMAANVSVNPEGGGTLTVGKLHVALSDKDLKGRPPAGGGQTLPGTGVSQPLRPGAGDGLDAAFRRTLSLVCSSTAFLNEGGDEDEFKVKRTKLRSGFPKPKKKKKKQALAEGEVAVGEGAGEADGTKKKKKRRRKKRPGVELDPVQALARNASMPMIHKELKDFELHRMMTLKVAASFLPDLPVKSRPVAAAQRSSAGHHGGGSKQDVDMPPDPRQMLEALRWDPPCPLQAGSPCPPP